MASNHSHSRELAALQRRDEVRVLRRRVRILTFLLLVFFLGVIVDIIFFRLPHSGVSQPQTLLDSLANPCKQSSFDNGNGIKVEPLPDKSEYIGISGGEFAFDKTRPDYALKCQGAQAFMRNQPDQAKGYWQQASAEESNDAEALIYQEDLRVKNSGKKYISFIIATILTGNYVNIGRDVLQGAYVAQYVHNHSDKLPQINLLIANFGSIVRENFQDGPGEEEQVANQIVKAVPHDSSIKGIMIGLPFIVSDRTITTLDTAGIPVVLSGGFDEAQIRGTNNIFPVAASTNREGMVGAKYVKQTFPNSKIALFENEKDPYSRSLAGAFQQYFPSKTIIREFYSVSDQPQDFQKKIHDLEDKGAKVIYFAGDSTNINNLLNNLTPGTNGLLVMGGDALYELGGYTGKNYNLLHFTAFAFPDEWYLPPQSKSIHSSVLTFLNEYPHLLGGSRTPYIYGYTRADSDTLLSYDATSVLVHGSEILSKSGTNIDFSSQALIDTLRNFSGSNAFQGFSGRISFGPDGANKAVLLLSVVDGGYTHIELPPDGCLQATQC
jgi:ABC-type branched-subunit amino acid transport system substrate-binding protein